MHCHASDCQCLHIESIEHGFERPGTPVDWYLQHQTLGVLHSFAQRTCRSSQLMSLGKLQTNMGTGHQTFEFLRCTPCYQCPSIEDCNRTGQLVRLLQVLRCQQDSHPTSRQLPNALPHHMTTARIQARRRLIEKNEARVAHQGHGQVQPAAHAP